MHIGIIGGGVSGLTAAYYLSKKYEVTLLEAGNYMGGHANTVDVIEGTRSIPIDTGFIVFNENNYPNLCKLFHELNVETIDTDMSFSVQCQRSGLEYNGTSLNKLFSQRKNIFNKRFWQMINDINRFNKEAVLALENNLDDQITVESFSKKAGYSAEFVNHYLVPLGASLWSSPADRFLDFPMLFVIEFLNNHHMLQVNGRPIWKTVKRGSREYVNKILESIPRKYKTSCKVSNIKRDSGSVTVSTETGENMSFDEVVVCSHSDQALKMIEKPKQIEQDLLGAFQYQKNEAVLHTDINSLPSIKNAWASWNYRIPKVTTDHVSVTYNMNSLQSLDSKETYCVSLNQTRNIKKHKILRRIIYHHPQFSPGRASIQKRHSDLIRKDGVSYCGAYWGFGFHEDGVKSALKVCDAFGIGKVI